MYEDDYESAYEAGGPPFAGPHDRPRGPWGGHRHGGGWGAGARRWGWRRPPFGPPPFARGPWREGPPWAWGEWRADPERERTRAARRSLRPEIMGVIALIRAAEPAHVEAIRGVLRDARRRIAAILAEERPAATPTGAPPDQRDTPTML